MDSKRRKIDWENEEERVNPKTIEQETNIIFPPRRALEHLIGMRKEIQHRRNILGANAETRAIEIKKFQLWHHAIRFKLNQLDRETREENRKEILFLEKSF